MAVEATVPAAEITENSFAVNKIRPSAYALSFSSTLWCSDLPNTQLTHLSVNPHRQEIQPLDGLYKLWPHKCSLPFMTRRKPDNSCNFVT
jgi:hypothetical protein